MRRFTQSALWKALDASASTPFGIVMEPDAALDEFIIELHNYCREETDLAERTRTLQIAASELAATRRYFPYGSGKNVATLSVIERTIAYLDCEMKIVEMEPEYPERFAEQQHYTPLIKWNGSIAELLEVAIPMQFSGKFQIFKCFYKK